MKYLSSSIFVFFIAAGLLFSACSPRDNEDRGSVVKTSSHLWIVDFVYLEKQDEAPAPQWFEVKVCT